MCVSLLVFYKATFYTLKSVFVANPLSDGNGKALPSHFHHLGSELGLGTISIGNVPTRSSRSCNCWATVSRSRNHRAIPSIEDLSLDPVHSPQYKFNDALCRKSTQASISGGVAVAFVDQCRASFTCLLSNPVRYPGLRERCSWLVSLHSVRYFQGWSMSRDLDTVSGPQHLARFNGASAAFSCFARSVGLSEWASFRLE